MSKELKKKEVVKEVVKEEEVKEVFDLADWLAEHSLCQGEDWEPYRGRREYCDIRLKDGTQIGPCWPNGDFIDLTDDDERATPYKDVVSVRYYESPKASEPEEDDDEDDEIMGGRQKEPNPDPDDDM